MGLYSTVASIDIECRSIRPRSCAGVRVILKRVTIGSVCAFVEAHETKLAPLREDKYNARWAAASDGRAGREVTKLVLLAVEFGEADLVTDDDS